MKQIKAFKDAIHKASNEAALFMTAHLKEETAASGWPDHISNRMKVSHSNGSFDVHTHELLVPHVQDLEYGTPDQRPTAAIRRFDNRTHKVEDFMVKRISKLVGDL